MAPLKRIIICLEADLLQRIEAAAKKRSPGAVEPNRSAWIRQACEEKLKRTK